METAPVMSASISTNLDDAVAARAREIAQREHRSMSNLVANAVAVFTDLPKDLRDALLELRAMDDGARLRALTRELSALAARARFDIAVGELVAERKFSDEPSDASDIEILETATKLTEPGSRHLG